MASVHGEDDDIFLEHKPTLGSFLSPSLSEIISSSGPKKEETSSREVKWENDGVSLTWQDLWISVSATSHPILQGLTGYAQPGDLLAIMGPSGCGKSTLLDALAGRLDSSTRQSGQILVNGSKQRLSFGTSAYVTRDDILFTTLTVRETIYYSASLQLPDSMPKSEKITIADTTIRDMGLQHVMNTRVKGGWGSKGISGGERRRVSICIEILTRPKLLYLDEPTSGLDSAASFHVMKRIASLARKDGRTVIASIHHPSSKVFNLFNNICLLSSGKTVYFGPSFAAIEFFSVNGFPCPTMMNVSEHYLKTINTDFDKEVEHSFGKSVSAEQATTILVTAYKSSTTRQKVDEEITKLHKLVCTKERVILHTGNRSSFFAQILVLTRRSFVNMNRDLGYYWLRFITLIALSFCVGHIFYNIGHSYSSIQVRAMMLMFIAIMLTFLTVQGFPSFVEDMKIFVRERANGHYKVAAFVFANTISSIPFLFISSVIPGTIIYFLTGLQRGIYHFAYFALVVFTCSILVESLMMVVASAVPNFLMGLVVGSGIQGAMILNAGFFRLPGDLPNLLWKYPMYFLAFHRYAIEGLYKNEYEGLFFPSETGGTPSIGGEDILKGTWEMPMGYSKWVDLFVLVGMVGFYRLSFFGILTTMEIVNPIMRSFLSKYSMKKRNTILVEPTSTPKQATLV